MLATRAELRKIGVHCGRFFHTSFKICTKRNLVPERFLNLAEITGLANTPKRKLEKKHRRTRLETSKISKKEYIYGISPCLTALEANRRKFYTIYFNDEALNTKSRYQDHIYISFQTLYTFLII